MNPEKHPEVARRVPRVQDGRIRGAALIIVLSFLIIITGLVVAFLSTVTDNATETSSAAAATTTRSLADTAVQLTIAQIRDATAGFALNPDGSYDKQTLMGWSSQPGAIRTFPTNVSNGVTYRLYSAPALRTNTPCSNDLPPSGWWNQTALYTDLNAPVVAVKTDGSGTNTNYPIMDPSMTNTPTNATSYTGPTVDGFEINSSNAVLSGYTNNPAAMPLLWLYMLKDGSLIPPDTNGSTTATFKNSPTQPTSNNPIVGRIAFWTDDETCKLNINTASEGVPWDAPTFTAIEDTAFQVYPPAGNEFNRFMGHPFSVSLSPVLWSFFGFPHPASLIWANPQNKQDPVSTTDATRTNATWGDPNPILPTFISKGSNSETNYLNALFGMSNVINGIHPRSAVSTNGSFFGSYQTADTNNRASFTQSKLRTDRLYSSVDELAFLATNSQSAISRAYNSDSLPPEVISKLRFFLTANSRAPEVNMFNLPRLCLWPLPDPNNKNTNNSYAAASFSRGDTNSFWSQLDQQIARCETIGTNAYYFTRFNATSQTDDFDNIPRNQQLYSYLVKLLQTPIPGYMDSFQNRWSSNGISGARACNQMATMLFDYIRGSVNLVDSYGNTNNPSTGKDAVNPESRYAYSYTKPPTNIVTDTSAANSDSEVAGTGQVLPLKIVTNGVTTRGMGRFPIVKSATLVFSAIAADQPPLMVNTNNRKMTNASVANNAVNPLYPFPVVITNAAVRTNFWELGATVANGKLSPCGAIYGGPYITPISTNGSNKQTNQYPSWNPTNMLGSQIVAAINAQTNSTGWIKVTADPANSSYLWGSAGSNAKAGITNMGGLTITHPGLVYSGDYNTNTGAFDLYNLFFCNVAGQTSNSVAGILGIDMALGNGFNFVTAYRTNGGVLETTNQGSLATLTVPIPSTNDPLFPKIYETVMQATLIIDYAVVNPGHAPINPNFKVRVRGLGNLTADGQKLFQSGDYGQRIAGYYHAGAGSGYGPDFGVSTTFYTNNMSSNYVNGSAVSAQFPFLGNFVKVTSTAAPNYGRTFTFASQSGTGTITIDLLKPTADYATSASDDIIQSVTMSFPKASFPTPKLPILNGAWLGSSYDSSGYTPYPYVFGTNDLTANPFNKAWPPGTPITFILPKYLFPSNSIQTINRFTDVGSSSGGPFNMGWLFLPELSPYTNTLLSNYFGYNQWSPAATFRSVEVSYGDWRIPAMMQVIKGPSLDVTISPITSVSAAAYTVNDPSSLYAPHRLYFGTNSFNSTGAGAGFGSNFFWRSAHTLRGQREYYASGNNGEKFVSPTMFLAGLNDGYYGGLSQSNNNYPGMIYNPVRTSSDNPERLLGYRISHEYPSTWGNYPEALSSVDFKGEIKAVPASAIFTNIWQKGGDFDNGPGALTPDGPYINKSDEGSTGWGTSTFGASSSYNGFQPDWGSIGRARFSPNKQIPSSGIFGSLPVGFDPSVPSITNAWQTLLFCPNPNGTNHVSLNKMPPDYMIMDLFEMPVVQPYPISAPLSTAGRVNLNYQIAPFNYIKRDSALRGVLKSVEISAVRDDDGPNYKYCKNDRTISPSTNFNPATNNYSYRFPVHLDNTLKQFEDKFATNGFFRSGAEICSVWLYPAVAPATDSPLNPSIAITNYTSNNSSISNWWYDKPGISRKGMTGDNSREKPYMAIYPNITTKSNTYQIHYRVQTLKQTPFAHPSDWAKWVEPGSGSGASDKITGDLRGSAIIERYIDATDEKIPDFAGNIASGGNNAINSLTNSLDPYYRYRVINSRFFTP